MDKMNLTDRHKRLMLLVFGLLALALLVNNHSITLWDEDEAAYAGFAQRMHEGESWVNPEYKWSTIHRKTPFHFWTIAISYKIFGVNEFALRFPSSLAIFLTCLSLFLFGRSIFGQKRAAWASIVLASTVILPFMGKVALTDATLLLAQTTAVLALLNYVHRRWWGWLVLFWGSIAVGVLVKGPPILILTGGLWLWLAVFSKNRKNLIHTHPWFWGLIALLPFAAWAYASYLQDYALWEVSQAKLPFEQWWQAEHEGKKVHLLPFLWDWYVVKRIGGSVLGQTAPPSYHLGILTLAFLPWLAFFFQSIWALGRQFFSEERDEKTVYLTGWLLFAWLFYELMSSKLPSYSLAAQPALALLVAEQAMRWQESKDYQYPKLWKFGLGFYLFVSIVLIIGVPVAAHYLLGVHLLPILFSLVLGSSLIYLLISLRANKERPIKAFAINGLVLTLSIWVFAVPVIEQTPAKGGKDLVQAVQKRATETMPVYLVQPNLKQNKPSLIFYFRNAFNHFEVIDYDQAVALYQSTSPVLVVGAEGIKPLQERLANIDLPEPVRVDWWSFDDQLRSHPFYILFTKK